MTYAVFFALVRTLLGLPASPVEAVFADDDVREGASRTFSDAALAGAVVAVLREIAQQAKAQFLPGLIEVVDLPATTSGGGDPLLPGGSAPEGASLHALPVDLARVLVSRVQALAPGGAAPVASVFLDAGSLDRLAESELARADFPAFALLDGGALLACPPAASVRVTYVRLPAAPESLSETVPVGHALVPALAFAACARLAAVPLHHGGTNAAGEDGAVRFFSDAYAAALRPLLRRRTSGQAAEVRDYGRLIDREVVTE